MPDRRVVPAVLFLVCLAGCSDSPREKWNKPLGPFHIYGNTYYVGTAGLSSILIATEQGLVLIDGGLPESAPLIERNVRSLGFDLRDVRIIAVSHEHYDHVGGVAALQEASGADIAGSARALEALADGQSSRDDPQFGPELPSFPTVDVGSNTGNTTMIVLGDTRLRGIPTPGHTPGGMSWTWQSCEDDGCLDVVYADSLGPVSAPGYRFSDGLGAALKSSAETIAKLDCDIFLSTHEFAFGLHEKLEKGREAFIDDHGCKDYAARALERLEEVLQEERLLE